MATYIQEDGGSMSGKEFSKDSVCEICKNDTKVIYDCKTSFGSWANLCTDCFAKYGVGLGIGKGQKYILKNNFQNN